MERGPHGRQSTVSGRPSLALRRPRPRTRATVGMAPPIARRYDCALASRTVSQTSTAYEAAQAFGQRPTMEWANHLEPNPLAGASRLPRPMVDPLSTQLVDAGRGRRGSPTLQRLQHAQGLLFHGIVSQKGPGPHRGQGSLVIGVCFGKMGGANNSPPAEQATAAARLAIRYSGIGEYHPSDTGIFGRHSQQPGSIDHHEVAMESFFEASPVWRRRCPVVLIPRNGIARDLKHR